MKSALTKKYKYFCKLSTIRPKDYKEKVKYLMRWKSPNFQRT